MAYLKTEHILCSFLLTALLMLIEGASLNDKRFLLVCIDKCTDNETGRRDGQYDTCPVGFECRKVGCSHICQSTIPEGCIPCKDLGCYNDACDLDGSGCPLCVGVGRK